MSVYSYVLRFDHGDAPNPYHNYCTLAICKPVIRRKAKPGDWVIGTGSRGNVNQNDDIPRIIYVMKISEVISLIKYFEDIRFNSKKPDMNSVLPIDWIGDNIYRKYDNKIVQIPSVHSNNDGSEDEESKKHDLKGENVLISQDYWYFGKNAIEIPECFHHLVKKNQGHKKIINQTDIRNFEKWIKAQKKPTTFLPCQPFVAKDELCSLLCDGERKSKKCFNDDCRWHEDDEEVIP